MPLSSLHSRTPHEAHHALFSSHRHHGGTSWKAIIALIPIGAATAVAVSRVMDYQYRAPRSPSTAILVWCVLYDLG